MPPGHYGPWILRRGGLCSQSFQNIRMHASRVLNLDRLMFKPWLLICSFWTSVCLQPSKSLRNRSGPSEHELPICQRVCSCGLVGHACVWLWIRYVGHRVQNVGVVVQVGCWNKFAHVSLLLIYCYRVWLSFKQAFYRKNCFFSSGAHTSPKCGAS